MINSLKLTDSQTNALELLQSFYKSNKNVFILTGSAGTGKTTLLKLMIDFLDQLDEKCIAAAPTGRAAQILRSKGIPGAQTIHKTIYTADKISEDENDNDVITSFRLATHFIPSNTLFLIDEASMISNTNNDTDILQFGSGCLLQDLLDFALQEKSNKIVFSGDVNQLPPINMDYSPALNKDYLETLLPESKVTEYELKEIVRQKKESSIIKTATGLKESIEKEDFRFINIDYSDNLFEEKQEALIQNFSSDFQKDSNETILIAYTNAQVFRYNQMMRKNLFPQIEDLNTNERLLVVNNNYKYDILNGEMITLKEILSETKSVSVRPRGEDDEIILKFREVVIEQMDKESDFIERECLIIENILFSNKPSLERDERRALIVHFHQRHPSLKRGTDEYFSALLADPYINALHVKFGYAATCHKAQGGEWNNVYFDFFAKSMSRYSKDYFRFCYTAVTRSKDMLKLINPPKRTVFLIEQNDIEDIVAEPQDDNYNGEPFISLEDFLNKIEKEFNIELTSKELYYRNRYMFEYENQPYKFDIIYNGKGKITGFNTAGLSEKLTPLVDKIKSLDGRFLKNDDSNEPASFDNTPELEDIYTEMKTKLTPSGIKISRVDHFNFMERYYFKKEDQIAIMNIYYNKDFLVTSFNPAQGELTLLHKEVMELLYAN